MKLKRTLTSVVLSTAIVIGCSPERTTKTLDVEEGRLEFVQETKFINLIFGNRKRAIYIEIEKYTGETEYYIGRFEDDNLMLENIKITNPSGEYEYSEKDMPGDYKTNFQRYVEEVKRE